MGIVILLITLILFILGVPLFVVLGIATALCFWLIEESPLVVIAQQMFTTTNSFPLLAIPFFVLAGMIMISGGIARRLVDFARSLVSWLPGGLGITTVIACMFFAAISGSSPATVAAIGMIMFPALIKERYQENFSLGLVTSAGSLGILIPPSIPMIIYGIIAGVSVNKLFIAGVFPGIFIGLLLITFTILTQMKTNTERVPFRIEEVFQRSIRGFWAILLPFLILGGIYSGKFTATEAAAVAVVYAFIVEIFIHKETSIKKIPAIFTQAAMNMGAILIIIAIAKSFSQFLTIQMVTYEIPEYIQSHISTKWGFLITLNLLLLLVGCLMDIISAILILAPLTAPIAKAMGVDPVHLGIIYIVNLEIGYLTPPIGINLFVSSVIFEKPIFQVIRSILPFLLLLLLGLIAVTYFPKLSLFLVEFYKGM
jgi:C4-dicarboxylate transporter DctM subunit